MARLPRDLASLWPAAAYPAALAAGSLTLAAVATDRRATWLTYASTNLDNLTGHPVRALLASAFLVQGDLLAWVLLAALGLAGVARAAGPGWALGVAAAAHLLGTAVSEGSLGVRVARGLAPAADRHLVDVGPSFVVVGTLVATVVAGTGVGWRVAAAVGFGLLLPSLFAGLGDGDVGAVGHVVSIGVGLAAGAAVLARRRRDGGTAASP
jgi:hypothetical protein